MTPFVEALERRVPLCDGAMGTMLYARGVFVHRSFDALNLADSDLVGGVHREYVRAGADVLETNTFGANRLKLAAFGLADQLHAINVAGVRIARQAAREQVYVAGAIGPLGLRIVAQMTTEEDGNTLDGTPPERFAPALVARGATIVGLNCSVGPAPMLETIDRIEQSVQVPLSAQPNAGRPRDIEGRTIYLSSPEYMASYARRFVAQGVRLVGGCCGTTPEHIHQIKRAVQAVAHAPAATERSSGTTIVTVEPPAAAPVPRTDKSRMAHALARGTFVLAAELPPPVGYDAASAIACAQRLKIRGVY